MQNLSKLVAVLPSLYSKNSKYAGGVKWGDGRNDGQKPKENFPMWIVELLVIHPFRAAAQKAEVKAVKNETKKKDENKPRRATRCGLSISIRGFFPKALQTNGPTDGPTDGRTDRRTDQRTDQRTDLEDLRTHLKIVRFSQDTKLHE